MFNCMTLRDASSLHPTVPTSDSTQLTFGVILPSCNNTARLVHSRISIPSNNDPGLEQHSCLDLRRQTERHREEDDDKSSQHPPLLETLPRPPLRRPMALSNRARPLARPPLHPPFLLHRPLPLRAAPALARPPQDPRLDLPAARNHAAPQTPDRRQCVVETADTR
ncbi:hypothetical protein M8818_002994 [Zalaria obscura]|uniref:Uncharacterized protein n=1 Tax=Zalaria obscura TaxID=2024903 RepID=A0ACC3SGJ2_9PEZI